MTKKTVSIGYIGEFLGRGGGSFAASGQVGLALDTGPAAAARAGKGAVYNYGVGP